LKDMEKQFSLICNLCGNDQFSTVDEQIEDLQSAPDYTEVECSDCGRVVTKDQLIDENSHVINENVEDFKKDIIKQLEKDLKKKFK